MVNCAFAGNSLQSFDGNHGIIVQGIEHAGKSKRSAITYALSHGNKSSIPFVEYPNKSILMTGQIVGTTIADCDAQIDTFNSYMIPQNGNLDFDYNGGSLNRRYIATAVNIDVTRPGGLAWADFTVDFLATQPFGQDTTTTSLVSASGRTSISYSDAITLAGTAPFQLPIITITYSAIGSAPVSGTVSIGNDSTGQQISIQRTWAATDVLVVDCTLNIVTVNGVAVNFTGAFPAFVVGSGTLDYLDTFASRTFAISALYTKLYL
jgi:Phage tail protein